MNAQRQSSQLAEPLWTDPGLKSGISVHDLISTSRNNNKKRRRGINCRPFSQNPLTRGKSHLTTKHNELLFFLRVTSSGTWPLKKKKKPSRLFHTLTGRYTADTFKPNEYREEFGFLFVGVGRGTHTVREISVIIHWELAIQSCGHDYSYVLWR